MDSKYDNWLNMIGIWLQTMRTASMHTSHHDLTKNNNNNYAIFFRQHWVIVSKSSIVIVGMSGFQELTRAIIDNAAITNNACGKSLTLLNVFICQYVTMVANLQVSQK